MAIELAVRAVTNRPHSGMPRRFFWAQGEVVSVHQSPHEWSREVDPDKIGRRPKNFWIITVLGINVDDPIVAELLQPGHNDLSTGDNRGIIDGNPYTAYQPISKRMLWLDVSLLPNRLRNQLRQTKRMTIDARDMAEFLGMRRERVAERTDDNEVTP